jgi:hypothetical protein
LNGEKLKMKIAKWIIEIGNEVEKDLCFNLKCKEYPICNDKGTWCNTYSGEIARRIKEHQEMTT